MFLLMMIRSRPPPGSLASVSLPSFGRMSRWKRLRIDTFRQVG